MNSFQFRKRSSGPLLLLSSSSPPQALPLLCDLLNAFAQVDRSRFCRAIDLQIRRESLHGWYMIFEGPQLINMDKAKVDVFRNIVPFFVDEDCLTVFVCGVH